MKQYLRFRLPINSEFIVDNITYRTHDEYYAVVPLNPKNVERSLKQAFNKIADQLPIQGKDVTFYPSDLFMEELLYEQKRN